MLNILFLHNCGIYDNKNCQLHASWHELVSIHLVIPQSQLACDGFAISLRQIYRHFRWVPRDSLRLLGHILESAASSYFNMDLKPGTAFLIAIWLPIKRSMPGRCPVGRVGPNYGQPRQSIYQSDTAQTPAWWRPAVKSASHRWPLDRHTTDSCPANVGM